MKQHTIGYLRVSSTDQNTDRQADGIADAGVELDSVFTEKLSGKDQKNRPELQNMLSRLQTGDVVVVYSIDRLARDMRDLLALVEQINQAGAGIRFIKERMQFAPESEADPFRDLQFNMLAAYAQFERSIIKQRQREGIDAALARGVKFGRKSALTAAQIKEIRAQREAGKGVTWIARNLDVSRQTIYRALEL